MDHHKWLGFSSAHGTTQHNKFVGAYGTGNLPVIFMDVPGNVITFRGFDDTPTSYFHMRDIEVNTRATTNRPTGIWVGESWYPNKPHHILLDGLHIKNCSNGMILYDRDIIVQNCLIMDNGNNNTGQGIFVLQEMSSSVTMSWTTMEAEVFLCTACILAKQTVCSSKEMK